MFSNPRSMTGVPGVTGRHGAAEISEEEPLFCSMTICLKSCLKSYGGNLETQSAIQLRSGIDDPNVLLFHPFHLRRHRIKVFCPPLGPQRVILQEDLFELVSRVEVPLTLLRGLLQHQKPTGVRRLTFGRIGGVICFASSCFQSIPSNHGIFLISESPAIPPLQHNRASLSFSTNLNSKHEEMRETRKTAVHSPPSEHRCTQNCTFPSDHGKSGEGPPCRCWPSTPDRFSHCMVGLRTSPHTT